MEAEAIFTEAASAIRVGDPFDPATQMGPVRNARRLPGGQGVEGGTEGFQAFEQVKFVNQAPH